MDNWSGMKEKAEIERGQRRGAAAAWLAKWAM